eukprot:TRINITY_DN16699_c0_g2_i1.p1 TRINITY_DN16699_c0_g2~~TRINITY_DN16699_c0_g2_i1.p1  ORF type:complete len:267 (+),score=70.19 TRINITY_DN16699_c0_g2_i1:66-866(+)
MDVIQSLADKYNQEIPTPTTEKEWASIRDDVLRLGELLGRKVGNQEVRKMFLNSVEELDGIFKFVHKVDEVELRISPDDGMPYSLDEFKGYYFNDWQPKWDAAEIFDNTAQEQRRFLGTVKQFEKYYGKGCCKSEWRAAERVPSREEFRWFQFEPNVGTINDFRHHYGEDTHKQVWDLAKSSSLCDTTTGKECRRFLGTEAHFEGHYGKACCNDKWEAAPIAREEIRWFEPSSVGSRHDFLQYYGVDTHQEMWELAKLKSKSNCRN